MEKETCDTTLLLLRGFDLFAQLSEEEYEALHVVHNYIEAKKGEYIYFPSGNKRKLFFTKEGYIKIGYIDAEGNESIKEIIQRGEVFGQITLDKSSNTDEFAIAYKGNVSLCAFDTDEFIKLLEKKPGMALAFSQQLGGKVKKIENRLMNLLNKNVQSRLIGLLLQLSVRNADEPNTAKIERFLTHDDMARLIGSSRQTVTTTLLHLVENEWIAINNKWIVLKDLEKLGKLAVVG